MNQIILIGMITLGVLLLIMSLCLHKMEVFFSYALKISFAVVSIYAVNMIVDILGYNLIVGLNGGNICVVTFLGAPGLAALYAITAYFKFM